MTLLDIVQSILSDMNSDAVNSISDTVESEQIALIVRDTYNEMVVSRKYLDLKKFVNLIPSTDKDFPTYMRIPDNVGEIVEIRFNNRKLKYLSPQRFIALVAGRQPESDNIFVMKEQESGMDLPIVSNADPLYWTSFDDFNVILDAWDSGNSETNLSRDIVAYAEVFPDFALVDTYVPKLPLRAYPLLLAEAKSKSFADIKQMASAKEEQKVRRLRGFLSTNKNITSNGPYYPDYGRKR